MRFKLPHLFEGWGEHPPGTPAELWRARYVLARLARATGVERGEDNYQTYLKAMRAHGAATGEEDHPHAARLRAIADGWQKRRGARAKEQRREQGERRRAAHAQARGLYLNIEDHCARHLGFIRGERVLAYEAGDLRPGDPAVVIVGKYPDGGAASVGRYVDADAETITLRAEDGETRKYRRKKLGYVGRIVGTASRLTDEEERRLTALRARLTKLSDIADSSERFRVEREIYDIEHPRAEATEEATEEWPDVLDDRRAA